MTTAAGDTTTTAPAANAASNLPLEALELTALGSCPEPWAPLYSEISSYPHGTTVSGSRPAVEERLDLPARLGVAPDTDGDGVPDQIGRGASGEEFIAGRADGELVLARPGGEVGAPFGQPWIGDLDGDGRDELLLYSTDERRDDPLRLVIVPGSLATGRHDPLEVAVLLPLDIGAAVVSIGDVDGDGGDDVAVSGGAVLSGVELLAVAGTGARGSLPDEIGTVSGRFSEPLWLAEGRPVFADVSADRSEVVLLTEPPLRLGFAGVEPPRPSGSEVVVGAYRSGGHRIVTVEQLANRSGVSGTWGWDLDAPCSTPEG